MQAVRRTATVAVVATLIGASPFLFSGPGAPVPDVAEPTHLAHAPGPAPEAPAIDLGDLEASALDAAKAELEQVQSLAVAHAREALDGAHRRLGAAHARRLEALESMLADMQKNGSSEAIILAVQSDLHRPLEDVANTKDSPYVHSGLQKDVATAFSRVRARGAELERAMAAFERLDEAYLAPGVAQALAPLDLSPADLKALVAQESGDHLLQDTLGDIAGIAQIGSREAREVAPHLDRKDDVQAIELAAHVLAKKAEQLEAMARYRGVDFDAVRASPDYPRFLFAAYNAGAEPIARALKVAKDAGLDFTSWDVVRAGGEASPLYVGLRTTRTYARSAQAKNAEVTTYVERIDARRPSGAPLDELG